jgi:prophage DNA circulation protein
MSWVEKVQNQISIQTGDGKVYQPLYSFYTKSIEFNFTEWNFPNITGSKVDRYLRKGNRFDMNIIFQGDDHLDLAAEFLDSAENINPWVLRHPFYDDFTVQPTNLSHDTSGLNTSVITGQLIETLTEDFPQSKDQPQGEADDYGADHSDASDAIFAESDFASADQQLLEQNLNETFDDVKDKITIQEALDEYFNYFNEASNAVINATSAPLEAIQTARNVYTYPALLAQSVKQRMGMLINQFQTVVSEVVNLVTPNEKKIVENNAGLTIQAMFIAAINPLNDTDYENVNDVFDIQDLLVNTFNQYIQIIDSLQTDTNDEPDSYLPDFESIKALVGGVTFVVANLAQVALQAQQQRIVTLKKDTNVIELTHRFYGLDPEDLNLDKFIAQNNIGLNELLGLEKGRRIVYYI